MRKVKSFISDNKENVFFTLVFLAVTVLCAFFGNTVLFFACLFAFFASVTYTAVKGYSRIKDKRNEPSSDVLEIIRDSALVIKQPILLLNNNDEIMWFNKYFSTVTTDLNLAIGQSVTGYFGGALCHSVLKNSKDELVLEASGRFYTVTAAEISWYEHSYIYTIWNDITAQRVAENTLKNKNMVIGYAAIDNAAEVASYLQEQYRTMIGKAYSELYAWVNSMDGIIREYDRDKYIIFVEYEKFLPNIVKKFDVLDRINTAIMTDGNRVTMSMGFAAIDGTFPEKDTGAREALEYAIQRGGAQIVVKTSEGSTSYGGQNKAGARITKIKSRVIADKLKALIGDSKNVLIMGHKNIDVDAFASACAVARLTMTLQKKVNIIVDENSESLKGPQALIKDLKEYDNVFIDKVCAQERLSCDTLLVVVDVNNPNFFESVDIYNNAHKVAIIDHHVQTVAYDVQPTLQYIDPTASSASELLVEILEQTLPRNAIKSAEAELLLAGILLDTKHLTRNIGTRTFGVTMFLHADNKMMSRARSLFSPSIKDYVKLSGFRKNTVIFREEIAISHYEDDNLPENRIIASIAADDMLEIENVRASFTLGKIGDDVHISGRSDGSMNVAAVLEALGGGGRFEAAATLIKDITVKDALNKLYDAINDTL